MGEEVMREADIQALTYAHPECLPIAEIDQMFLGPVVICRELVTQAGPIDILMVTPSGLPILVECKLWRNPEARRGAIAEYLQMHAGLRFSLGLIELPVYAMPDGSRLVTPRVLARTLTVAREVVALPDGYTLQDAQDPEMAEDIDPERIARGEAAQSFWKEFLEGLRLDDPEQRYQNHRAMGMSIFRFLLRQAGSMSIVICSEERWALL
jgi:hypothetical protein